MRKYWHVLAVLVLLAALSGCGMIFDLLGDLDDGDDDDFVPAITADQYEDDSQYTTDLSVGGSQLRTLHDSVDVDWVRIYLTENSTYQLETYSAGNGRDVDTVIMVHEDSSPSPPTYLDESHATWYDDDDGDGTYSYIQLTANYTGYHWVRIRGYSGGTGEYWITLY